MSVRYLTPRSPRLCALVACSPDAAGSGHELKSASATFGHLLEAIAWLGPRWPAGGRFVMASLPAGLIAAQARVVVDAARAHALDGKLCLVGAMERLPDARAAAALSSGGVLLVLDDVGRATRFGDLTALPLDGIRFEAGLVERSFGDPVLAPLVDGAVHIARNLGLTTFARSASTSFEPEPYADLIDYVSVADAADERPRAQRAFTS